MADKAAKKALILQTTERMFATSGYDGATISDIASEAGVAVGSLTHFFHDKPRLSQYVMDAAAGQLADVIHNALQPGPDIKDSIDRAIRAFFGWAYDQPLAFKMAVELGGRVLNGRTILPILASKPVLGTIQAWAVPLMAADRIRHLDDVTLGAVLLGGAWAFAVARPRDEPGKPMPDQALIDVLATGAIAALGHHLGSASPGRS